MDDKAKLIAFAASIRAVFLPTMTNEGSNAVHDDVAAKRESFAKWLETQAATL